HCRLVAAALAVLVGWGIGTAQEVASRKIYTKSPQFGLPVLGDIDRANLAEIKLYVKAPPGDWTCHQTGPATQARFSFRAPQDGEYWFTFVFVDRAGHASPADPATAPPGLVVVVDSQPPEIDARPITGSSGQAYLQCKMIDANPDYLSVRAEYEAAGAWQK